MRVFFSGIGGVGIGPLALIARDMGYDVTGSDSQASRYTELMTDKDVDVHIGQTGDYLKSTHKDKPFDWFVYTAALPVNHPELKAAQDLGIRTSKRDEFLNELITQQGLKLLAVSGTHGKTTTTGMLIWLLKELDQPISYSIGTNISYGPSGQYAADSQYFVYEADEYDRNFLQFSPFISLIPAIDFDHADTYSDQDDYFAAFRQFISQSHCAYLWRADAEAIGGLPDGCVHTYGAEDDLRTITLGGHNKRNAWLAIQAVHSLFPKQALSNLIDIINHWPGTERRWEKLAHNLYTDYAHHPAEISSTLDMAAETSKNLVVVYQPHQNLRQHQLKKSGAYKSVFARAKQVYWLPTYLSREPKDLPIIEPEQLINDLDEPGKFQVAELDDSLKRTIQTHVDGGDLVVLMGAGDIDAWARKNFS